MLYINAPLSTLKTAVILTAIPFILILVVKIWGLFKWLREDYRDWSTERIIVQARQLAVQEEAHRDQAQVVDVERVEAKA